MTLIGKSHTLFIYQFLAVEENPGPLTGTVQGWRRSSPWRSYFLSVRVWGCGVVGRGGHGVQKSTCI